MMLWAGGGRDSSRASSKTSFKGASTLAGSPANWMRREQTSSARLRMTASNWSRTRRFGGLPGGRCTGMATVPSASSAATQPRGASSQRSATP